jgi:hypothetical protein
MNSLFYSYQDFRPEKTSHKIVVEGDSPGKKKKKKKKKEDI